MSFHTPDSDISDDSGEEIWDFEELEASLEAESESDHQNEKTLKPRKSRKKHKHQELNEKLIPGVDQNTIREAITMMNKLSSRSVRDVVGHYLMIQPPIVALNLVNKWFSFWRRQILSKRQTARRISFNNKQFLKKSESKSKPMDYLNRENASKLYNLYISDADFSEEDRSSMLECLSRNFPKYSKEILRKILKISNYHLYLSVNNLLQWRAEGHPLIFRGRYIFCSIR